MPYKRITDLPPRYQQQAKQQLHTNPTTPPPPPQNESEFTTQIKQLFRMHGWLTYHTLNSKGSDPGWPDLVLLHPTTGKLLYRELKLTNPQRTLTPHQKHWLQALQNAHQDATTWTPQDWPTIIHTATHP